MNQQCKVCGEPAAGFHFGAFTCEGCKSFFGRTYNNLSSISECKNNGECVINKKNRTACKACRLRKCLLVGMSKSGSRYGRRSNWFKIHCLLQEQQQAAAQQAAQQASSTVPIGHVSPSGTPLHKHIPQDLAGFFAQTFASSLHQSNNNFLSPMYQFPSGLTIQHLQNDSTTTKSSASDSGTSSAEEDGERSPSVSSRSKSTTKDQNFFTNKLVNHNNNNRYHPFQSTNGIFFPTPLDKSSSNGGMTHYKIPSLNLPISPASDPGGFYADKRLNEKQVSPSCPKPPLSFCSNRVSVSSLSWPNASAISLTHNGIGNIDPNAWKDLWLRTTPAVADAAETQEEPIDLSVKGTKDSDVDNESSRSCSVDVDVEEEEEDGDKQEHTKTTPLDLSLDAKRSEELAL